MSDILDLEQRRRIYDIVQKLPGLHFREIQRQVQLATGSVTHHLHYLARAGLIEEQKDQSNLRYFPKEFSKSSTELMSLLRQRSIRRILVCIIDKEPVSHEQITQFVAISPSTITFHLKRLEQQNIIESKKQGRNKFFTLKTDKEQLTKLLITYKETFLDSLIDNIIEMWD
ncbi:winged helix-turn-helix transcriptional regulator [Candidatus Woesearchaeota archaeon]|nr:winged helix-turn-helix transcriptional regulator [Candidatus Woesearchaeota archaeon]